MTAFWKRSGYSQHKIVMEKWNGVEKTHSSFTGYGVIERNGSTDL
ncbi:hypothetical protein VCLMA_B0784 [Vibrio cholerae LMA3984-4]|nr:hypothetical protein VCLMA_B0784 [Vibrio cholerae LMA3984-4]